MNNRNQSCCQRPTMSGLRFVFRTLTLLRTTIMLFIRSAPNCDFVRKNHQRRTRLKRLFKLCSLRIGSYNINIGLETINAILTSFVTYSRLRSMMNINIRLKTTNAMLTSFVTYSRLRSMMNLLLRIIINVVLELLLFLRSIKMRRKLF
jgi:hypothetical protein